MSETVPVSWIPEDDLLLKDSIEAGASLEALAKGAVNFSRRFTIRELRDRWHSLLYDPIISTQASARITEIELSGSSPSSKFSRSENNKCEDVTAKRKITSIRTQYNAMRKRLRSEIFNSTDMGFLDGPNLHDCGAHPSGFQEHLTLDNEPGDHFGLQDSDFDILSHDFPQIGDIAATNIADNSGIGCQNLVEANHSNEIVRRDSLYGYPEDIHPLRGTDGRASFDSHVDHKNASHMLSPTQELPNGKHFEVDDSEMKGVSGFHPLNGNPQNLGSGFGGRHIRSPDSDGSASFHVMGSSSPLPRLPPWKTMEDISVPAMPVHMNDENRTQGAEGTSAALPDNSASGEKSPTGYHHSESQLRDRHNIDFGSMVGSEGDFADLPDSLLDFVDGDDVFFMDVDVKDKMDKSCYDNVNSLIIGSANDAREGGLCDIEPMKLCDIELSTSLVPNPCLGTHNSPCAAAAESENIASSGHDGVQQSVCIPDTNVASTSVLNPDSVRHNEGYVFCAFNTEDPEIPCNDDIFLLIHPTTSFASARKQSTIDSTDPTSSAEEKDHEQGVKLMAKAKDPAPSFACPPVNGPNKLPVKPEVSDTKCPNLVPGESNSAHRAPNLCRPVHASQVTTADGVLEEGVTKVKPKVVDQPSTSREILLHAEARLVKKALPKPVVNHSMSDQDESESDNDVPYFSDVEAMILEMDLDPYDEDSYTRWQASRYQDEDAKRKIIRLEQCARSSLQRTMSSHGALALLYGRHLKHYIRKTEVLLGRSTDDVDVDVDLRKEGRANKISRRQAIIKMDTDGSFFLKNLGKSSISVNGKAVAGGELMILTSSCLIEIRGMSFIFEINDKYVRRYLDTIVRNSQMKNGSFEWSPGQEP